LTNEIWVLTATAFFIGSVHTLLGPDHYLPFIVMGQARKWSLWKTSWITFLCGVGHVLSSVVLGLLGVALGVAVSRLESVESTRGELAGWAFICFGLIYMVWGIRRAWKNKPHSHVHLHEDGSPHQHEHTHTQAHSHVHDASEKKSITPWVLFTIFVLGPCEPLIPILMYPAAQKSLFGLLWVTTVFGVTTITTMMTIVILASKGLSLVRFGRIERYAHAIAGGTIFLSGMAIQVLGL